MEGKWRVGYAREIAKFSKARKVDELRGTRRADFEEFHLRSLLRPLLLVATEHVGEGRREDERRLLALDAELALVVAEKVPKIDVEEVTVFLNHHVVVVTVADAQCVRRDTVASA